MAELPNTLDHALGQGRSGSSSWFQEQSREEWRPEQPSRHVNVDINMAALLQNGALVSYDRIRTAMGNDLLSTYRGWDHQSHSVASESWSARDNVHAKGITSAALPHSMSSTRGTEGLLLDSPSGRPLPSTSRSGGEEGELSDGEYQQTEPRSLLEDGNMYLATGRGHQSPTLQTREASQRTIISRNQYTHPAYSPEPTDAFGRSIDSNRLRSKSYSPHISPVQPNQAALKPRHPHKRQRNSTSRQTSLSGLELHGGPEHPDASNAKINIKQTLDPLKQSRERAKDVILSLWPFNIRLMDYIQEGIDENVVRGLFVDLGIDSASDSVSHGLTSTAHSQTMQGKVPSKPTHDGSMYKPTSDSVAIRTHHHDHKENDSQGSAVSTDVAISSRPDPKEERKDRIARLLAEKAKKLSLSTAPVESPVKADKERLLRQKMEALQASREARALKASSKPIPVASATISSPASIESSSSRPRTTTSPTITSRQGPLVHPLQSTTKPTALSPASQLLEQMSTTIPGLFLAGGTNHVQNYGIVDDSTPNPLRTNTNVSSRKRPIASDFDDRTAEAVPHKRPFGQSRNDGPFVIDVSDEESEHGDSADLSAFPRDKAGSEHSSSHVPSTTSIRDHPPLSVFPPRKIPTPVAVLSAPSTPQQLSRPAGGSTENLQKRELEIQDLKRRIALAELKKKAKQAVGSSLILSAGDPPSYSDHSKRLVPARETTVDNSEVVPVRSSPHAPAADANFNMDNGDVPGLGSVVVTEDAVVHQRRLRRAKILTELAEAEAQVRQRETQLSSLEITIETVRGELQHAIESKGRLVEQMTRLSDEADEQVQEEKEKLRELETEEMPGMQLRLPMSTGMPVRSISNESQASASLNTTQSTADVVSFTEVVSNPPRQGSVPATMEMDTLTHEGETIDKIGDGEHESPVPAHDTVNDASIAQLEKIPMQVRSNHLLDDALQSAVAEQDIAASNEQVSDVQMEDAYLVPTLEAISTGKPSASPVPHAVNNLLPADPTTMTMTMTSESASPPDNVLGNEDANGSMGTELAAPIVDADPLGGPELATSTNNEESLPSSDHYQNLSINAHRAMVSDGASKHRNMFVENKSQLQADQAEHFTPYRSPLKQFHAYRFHPRFEEETIGGFKSMTYSNRIKQDVELCRFELAGGICNDPTCEYQHFRTLGLADDAILVELGNSAGYSDIEKPKFISGLRGVLQGLRQRKTKEFKVIASEIAAFRSHFLGDPSRILMLDGVDV